MGASNPPCVCLGEAGEAVGGDCAPGTWGGVTLLGFGGGRRRCRHCQLGPRLRTVALPPSLAENQRTRRRILHCSMLGLCSLRQACCCAQRLGAGSAEW